jgi:hypothetical protein
VPQDVRVFDAFGKGEIKKVRVSPDGFIQMALQVHTVARALAVSGIAFGTRAYFKELIKPV